MAAAYGVALNTNDKEAIRPLAQYVYEAVFVGDPPVEYVDAMSTVGNVVPVQVGELSGFENETTYFVVVEQIEASQLGAMVYVEREAFGITYYGQSAAKAARERNLEWYAHGRNKMAAGHPYLIYKIAAS